MAEGVRFELTLWDKVRTRFPVVHLMKLLSRIQQEILALMAV